MKNIVLLQNSQLSFGLDIEKIYNPKKYKLFLIVNQFGLSKLKERYQDNYFEKIIVCESFSFTELKNILSPIINQYNQSFEIVTNAEEAVSVCGKLRVHFGLDQKNYERFINKYVMKERLNCSGIRLPKYLLFNKTYYINNNCSYLDDIVKKIGFPMIAKPIDQASCAGVHSLNSINELECWAKSILENPQTYEIDEYISGTLFHCDSYFKNKKILFTQVSECSRPCYDFIQGKSKGSIALASDSADYIRLVKFTELVFEQLDAPQAGVTHLEVFKTEADELVFLEVGYRSPGILIPEMYRRHLNIDTIESHILLQIDEIYQLNIKRGVFAAWVAFPKKEGIVCHFNTPSIDSEFIINYYAKAGDRLSNPTLGRDYAATMLLWNHTYLQLQNDFDCIKNFDLVTFK